MTRMEAADATTVTGTYPLAPDPVFRTVQGEGALCGVPTTFVRLGGCSVGCPGCDTDYRVRGRATAEEIVTRCLALGHDDVVWVTGGEPCDHDLAPLLAALKRARVRKVCLATSGHRTLTAAELGELDWLSVSPHDPHRWAQRWGSELKLCPGLDGHTLAAFAAVLDGTPTPRFEHYFACPLADREGRYLASEVTTCVAWVEARPGWRLGAQAHKQWGLA